jgi:hypothetical protein
MLDYEFVLSPAFVFLVIELVSFTISVSETGKTGALQTQQKKVYFSVTLFFI